MSGRVSPGIAVMVLAAGAVLLRVANVGLESLWLDEVVSLILATGHAPRASPGVTSASALYDQYLAWQAVGLVDLITVVRQDIHPPLYFLTLNWWTAMFGTSEAALRGLSVVASALVVLPVYGLGRIAGGPRAGLWAALLVALSPAQIYFAQEARMYSLAMLFTALSSLCLWRLLLGPRHAGWAAAYLVSVLLGLATHYVFTFILVFHALFAAVHVRRATGRLRWSLVVPGAVLFVAVLSWPPLYIHLFRFVAEARVVAADLLSSGPGDVLHGAYLVARVPLRAVAGENPWAKLACLVLLAGALAAYVVSRRRTGFRWDTDGFLWCWLVIPLTCHALVDVVFHSRLVEAMRFTMLASMPMYVVAGVGLDGLASRGPGGRRLAALAAAVMLVLSVGTVSSGSPLRYPMKSGLRERVADLDRRLEANDTILIVSGVGPPQLVAYYLHERRPAQPMVWMLPSDGRFRPPPDERLLHDVQRIWLFAYRSPPAPLAELQRRLDAAIGPGRQVQPGLWLYQRGAGAPAASGPTR